MTAPLNDPSHDFAPRFGLRLPLRETGTVIRGGYRTLLYPTHCRQRHVCSTAILRGIGRTRITRILTAPDLTLADGFLTRESGCGFHRASGPGDDSAGLRPGLCRRLGRSTFSRSLPGRLGRGDRIRTGRTLFIWITRIPRTRPLRLGPGSVQSRRPLPQWGAIRVFGTDGVSYYNAFQTRLQSSNWHGLNLLGSYT